MKRILTIVLAVLHTLLLAACGSNPAEPGTDSGGFPPAQRPEHPSASDEPETSEFLTADAAAITISVGDRLFSAALLENESARQFASMLPLTLDMSELNGNEKYFYLDNELPADSCQPGQIHAGDLMLYGNSCLVLFYETFSSSYSYTQLGSVDDPAGLAEALGSGNATVTFSVED